MAEEQGPGDQGLPPTGQQCTSPEEAGGGACEAGFQAHLSPLRGLNVKSGSSDHDGSSLSSF